MCVIGSSPGCSRSNSSSNPGILTNILHKVKTRDGERILLNTGNKKLNFVKYSTKYATELVNRVVAYYSYYLELPDTLLGWSASMSAATSALVIGLARYSYTTYSFQP